MADGCDALGGRASGQAVELGFRGLPRLLDEGRGGGNRVRGHQRRANVEGVNEVERRVELFGQVHRRFEDRLGRLREIDRCDNLSDGLHCFDATSFAVGTAGGASRQLRPGTPPGGTCLTPSRPCVPMTITCAPSCSTSSTMAPARVLGASKLAPYARIPRMKSKWSTNSRIGQSA